MKQIIITILLSLLAVSQSFAQKDGKSATLHFLRTDRLYGKWVKVNVIMNDSIVGKLKNAQRLIYEVSTRDSITVSGLYKLMNKQTDESITFQPEPGKDYYFEIFFYGDMYKPTAVIWTGTTAMQMSEPVEYGVKIVGLDPVVGREKFNDESLFKNKNETIVIK
jgi:hypothetical protein